MEALRQRLIRYRDVAQENTAAAVESLTFDERTDFMLWSSLVREGRTALVEHGLSKGYIGDLETLAQRALSAGNTDILRMAGMQYPSLYATAVAQGSQIKFEWLEMNGVPMDRASPRVCTAAARAGNLRILRMCVQRGFAAGRATVNASRDLAIVKYLVEEAGVPLEAGMLTRHAKAGRDDIVRYMVGRRCPVDAAFIDVLVRTKNKAMLAWIREHGVPWRASFFAPAAARGCEEMITWLHAHGCPLDRTILTCSPAISDLLDRL